jgi:hypothetical protein
VAEAVSGIDWEKRARELAENEHESSAFCELYAQEMLRFAREMADARAEEIAERLDALGHEPAAQFPELARDDCRYALYKAAQVARLFISKPQTREQVLEEALLRIQRHVIADAEVPGEAETVGDIATDALDWKP